MKKRGPITSDPLDAMLHRLTAWLSAHRAHFLVGLRPGASNTDIARLEQAAGRPVPPPLRQLLAWHDGQRDSCYARFIEGWSLLGSDKMAALLVAEHADTTSTWPPGWFPFLDNDQGDYIVVDAEAPGGAVLEVWLGQPKPETVAPTFLHWLSSFVCQLEAGDYREDPERGWLMHRGVPKT